MKRRRRQPTTPAFWFAALLTGATAVLAAAISIGIYILAGRSVGGFALLFGATLTLSVLLLITLALFAGRISEEAFVKILDELLRGKAARKTP